MNMKKMKVKKKIKNIKKTEKINSGIPGFDKLIEGGFEKNSVNLIIGNSGSGKTIFAVQFLIEGIKNGEKCLYVTFEEKKEEFYRNMLDFGWNLSELEKQGKFTFLEYTPEKVKTMLEEGGGMIESLILDKKIARIVIDSITSFALLFAQELDKREAALSLFDMIRKWNCTSFLTLEENTVDRKEGSSSSLEFEVDSIILLYFVRCKEERERFIEVLKMRGTKHSTEVYPFEISKNGIILGSKSDAARFLKCVS
jgi:circadian clock protein KaiC